MSRIGFVDGELNSTAGLTTRCGINQRLDLRHDSGVGTVRMAKGPSKCDGVEVNCAEEVQTTDATETTVASLLLTADHVYHITAVVVARQASAAHVASYEIKATFYDTGSAAAQVGTTTIVHEAETDADWNVNFDTDGADTVRVRVTGDTGATVEWGCVLTYTSQNS